MGANLVKIDNAAETAWIVSKRGKHHVSIIALRINIIADSLLSVLKLIYVPGVIDLIKYEYHSLFIGFALFSIMTKGHESCCYYFNDHEKKSLFLSIQTCYIIDMGYNILSDYNETFISNVFSRNIELVHAQVPSVYTEQILPVITLNWFSECLQCEKNSIVSMRLDS